ncbi:MAG: hypothetical protein MSH10_05525 [Pygmaiobacter massiliensis]|nr:hypothetical protein [Pygmaiobacter massiliensis]
MQKQAVCEITVTGTAEQEWQGSVYFPSSGERRSFKTLLEMIKTVEYQETKQGSLWKIGNQ